MKTITITINGNKRALLLRALEKHHFDMEEANNNIADKNWLDMNSKLLKQLEEMYDEVLKQ